MSKGGAGVRRPKAGPRGHPPPGDFIALGPVKGSGRTAESELKPLPSLKVPQPIPLKKPGGIGTLERKREPSSPMMPLGAVKRPKLSSPPYSPHSVKTGDGESSKRSGASGTHSVQVIPIEVKASELEERILDAESSGSKQRVDALILGAMKSLRSNRAKPDIMMVVSLMYLAKSKPEIFMSRRVVEALTGILKRDVALNIKTNKSSTSLVPFLACNILMFVFQEEEDWPESFVKVYVEDALGDRIWVDSEKCQSFVDNILTAFETKKIDPGGFQRQSSDPAGKTVDLVATALPTSSSREDEEVIEQMETAGLLDEEMTAVFPRFVSPSVVHNIESYVLELVQDQLTRRQPLDSMSRNLLKLLTVTCGYSQVRLLVSQKMESWLQNPKLTRPSQELLLSLCVNCDSHSHEDVEVISNLIRIRIKTKPTINHFVLCIRELVNQHPENLHTLMKHVIYNELSTSRNPNNMALLGMVCQSKPDQSAKLLSMVFQDLLANRDDYLRASRSLLREIVRAQRHELQFPELCRGFMQERPESQFKDLEPAVKDRMLLSLTDLISMSIMLSVTPAVKDSAAAFNRGDRKDISVLHEFQRNVSTMQRDAVWWIHTVVPKMFTPNGKDYLACLNKVLFLDSLESYTNKDGWPPENDRGSILTLLSENPVKEDTLMRVIIIGLSNELPVTAPEALDLADRLVRRAAALKTDLPALTVTRLELLDAVLNLCGYHHPKDIELPDEYLPPKLAISNLYWKGWVLLGIVAALNPSTIGQSGWQNFPMLNCFMEMIMTNNLSFPPPTSAATTEERELLLAQEQQLAQTEKEEILEFECHLAAATSGVTITESNSLLLSQLINMDPVGPARRPPQNVIKQLKETNHSLKLGHMLCRSRSPDFLLDIIQRQGTSQSMPWLADLVQSSEGSLDVLPVQCLCEFLLLDKPSENKKGKEDDSAREQQEKRLDIQKHVLARLHSLLFGVTADAESTVEVLECFMRRLFSSQTLERDSAVKGLELVLSQKPPSAVQDTTVVCEEEGISMVTTVEEASFLSQHANSSVWKAHKWLLANLSSLPHFDTVRPMCCQALRQACQVEIIPERLQAYLLFLSEQSSSISEEEFTAATVDLSQLIIERATIINKVLDVEEASGQDTLLALLTMFVLALQRAIEAQEGWQDNQDQMFVQWSKDTEFAEMAATLHLIVIHAMIVLLTYGMPKGDNGAYTALLDAWCPERGDVKVYVLDTGEEAVLLQEWIKLRMIRSYHPRIVDAALRNLMPAQLVLFAQSFGITVSSMSQLLQLLDCAAHDDAVGIQEAVLDKAYMVQLVEVQQSRGATGGDVFCSLLTEATSSAAALEPAEDGRLCPLPVSARSQQDDSSMDRSPVGAGDLKTKEQVEETVNKIIPMDSTSEPVDHVERKRLEQLVIKNLTKDVICANRGEFDHHSIAENLLEVFLKLLESSCADRFIEGMYENSGFSCSVLRLLVSRQTALKRIGLDSDVPRLLQKLSVNQSKGGPLGCALRQYKKQMGLRDVVNSEAVDKILSQIITSHPRGESTVVRKFLCSVREDLIKPEHVTVEMAVKACVKVKNSASPLYEDFVKAILTLLVTRTEELQVRAATSSPTSQQFLSLKSCTEILTHLLSTTPDDTSLREEDLTGGLAIDWFELVDPEVVHVYPVLQRHLLFSDRPSGCSESAPAYLLSLLAHQASWNTLQDCLDWLLTPDGDKPRLNSRAVLDFVWTCFHIPRLWQGREQRSTGVGIELPNTAVYEDPVLNLTTSQLSSLTNFILSEVAAALEERCIKKGNKYKAFLDQINSAGPVDGQVREDLESFVAKMIERRLPLTLLCSHNSDHKLQIVVDSALRCTRWSKWLTTQFLVHLYLTQPRTLSWIKDSNVVLCSGAYSKAKYSQLDVLCHRVLTVLASCRDSKEYEDQAYNAGLLCKKIAFAHPTLLLRHLPMVAGLLRGRVHLTSKEFSNQQHLLFFSHILGLMDLLRPHIFKQDRFIQDGLRGTVEVYFDLVQSHCLAKKDRAGILTKFMAFLHHFCTKNPDEAIPILHSKAFLLQDLIHQHPDLLSLKCLLSAVSAPSRRPWNDRSASDTEQDAADQSTDGEQTHGPGKSRAIIMPFEESAWTPTQLAPFIQRISSGQTTDDVLKVLVDLDETSKRRVDVLHHFLPELTRLMNDSNCTARTKAHSLLLRHIRQNPGMAHQFVEAYMECFNSSAPEVILSAAKNLPEIVSLCNEHAGKLLQKLFSVAVHNSVDVGVPLVHSFQLLNVD